MTTLTVSVNVYLTWAFSPSLFANELDDPVNITLKGGPGNSAVKSLGKGDHTPLPSLSYPRAAKRVGQVDLPRRVESVMSIPVSKPQLRLMWEMGGANPRQQLLELASRRDSEMLEAIGVFWKPADTT